MAAISPTAAARVAGALLGAGVALALLLASRPAASFARLPASAAFTVAVSGEFAVTPAAGRPFLRARALTPGATPATASFTVRNQTGSTLALGFRARAGAHQLDGLLHIRLRSGDTTLANTTLQGLRHGSASGLRLRPGGARSIALDAWIPDGTIDYEGRDVAVELMPTLLAAG
ncbi:MAG: hypothetical protein QOI73_2108 [Solirubrobacteraceae bacterium]|nr:hypothetical protein [Solirubrobacteraceae bacterium]